MGAAAEIKRIARRVMSPSIRRDLEGIADSIDAPNGAVSDELAHLAGIRNAIGANAEAQAHFERASASFVARLLNSGDALPGTTARFGTGRLIVNTGTYGDEPAVFVDAAPYRGGVGEKAPDIPAGTPAMLRLLFPTREQAKAVCDALVMPADQAASVTVSMTECTEDAAVRRAIHAYDSWMAEHQPDKDDAYYEAMHAALKAARDPQK